MSYSEKLSPTTGYSADPGEGSAAATRESDRDVATREDSAAADNVQQDAASQDAAPQDTAPQDTAPQHSARHDAAGDTATPAAADGAEGATPANRAPSDGQLRPDARADDPVAALWGADLVDGFRTRWQTLQLAFVDDPRAATQDAARLVDEAVQSLTSALDTQKRSLDEWQNQDRNDTEVLRTALQNYRDFLDRLLGM